jgi:hypothetical protein
MHDSRWYRKPSRTPADLSNELNMSDPLQGDSQAWMILESVPNVASTDKTKPGPRRQGPREGPAYRNLAAGYA